MCLYNKPCAFLFSGQMKKLFTAYFFLCLPTFLLAQHTVGGIIYGHDELPLQNAIVYSGITMHVAQTDENGSFTLSAEDHDSLYISCIGYRSVFKEIYADDAFIIIHLKEDTIFLDQVEIISIQTPEELRRAFLKMDTNDTVPLLAAKLNGLVDPNAKDLIELPKIHLPTFSPYPGVYMTLVPIFVAGIPAAVIATNVNINEVYTEIKRTSKKRKLAASGTMPKW